MLTPLHLRLCGFPAMAPALTEAASQAPNFKLPYTSPATGQSAPGTPILLDSGQEDIDDRHRHEFGDSLPLHEQLVRLVPRKRLIFHCNSKDLTPNLGFGSLNVFDPSCTAVDSDLVSFDPKTVVLDDDCNGGGGDGNGCDFVAAVLPELKPPVRDIAKFCRMNSGGSAKTNHSSVVDAMGMLKTPTNIKLTPENNNNSKSNPFLLPSVNHLPNQTNRCVEDLPTGNDQAIMSNDEAVVVKKEVTLQVDSVTKETMHRNRVHEVSNRQLNMQRRTECLLRRIQKLQALQVKKHVTGQLSVLVENQQQTLQLPSRRERLQQGLRTVIANSGGNVNSTDLKAEILQCEDVKNLSTAALVNLVRKLESTHGSPHRQKYITLQHLRTVDKVENAVTTVKLPEEKCAEMKRVAGTLMSNVRHLEKAIDSDATESSSGGESCDELDDYDPKKPHPLPINKRAAWKWAVDRSAVACRWTWLQAQVSDLEYRIRQQNDAYRQIRASKGPVVLEAPSSSPSPSSLIPSRLGSKMKSATSDAASRITNLALERRSDGSTLPNLHSSADANSLSSNGNVNGGSSCSSSPPNNSRYSIQVNGFVGSTNSLFGTNKTGNLVGDETAKKCKLPNGDLVDGTGDLVNCLDNQDGSELGQSVSDQTCTSARTRALKGFRKRRLLCSSGLYQVSHKAAKLSTSRCGCLPPDTSCTMCGGRINNVQHLEPDSMPLEEKVALLDQSFHPVLSFEQDIFLHIHFESLIRGGDWHRAAQKPKSTAAARKKARVNATNGNDVHKRSRKLKKNATATLTAKLKKKLTEGKRGRGRGNSSSLNMNNKAGRAVRMRKKPSLTHNAMALKKQRERNMSGSSGSSSKPASPVPSLGDNSLGSQPDHKDHPRKSSMLQELIRRRRGESAFDINNIVIPYSMAAATRVERLQYKEILTPKWRFIENQMKEEPITPVPVPQDNGIVCRPTTEEVEPIEDLTDETFDTRHEKCELEEKKRFMGYMQSNTSTGAHHPHHPHLAANRGRPRQMRSDSRADSSGANTPDPMSPYPMEPHESPMTTPPSTPAPVVVMEENAALYGKGSSARRRTTSLSKHRDRTSTATSSISLDEWRAASPDVDDDEYPVMPWDKRTFPLTDEDLEEMLKWSAQSPPPSPLPALRRRTTSEDQQLQTTAQPIAQPQQPLAPPPDSTIQPTAAVLTPKIEPASRPATPMSSSSTTSVVGDDPNDPEWTVSAMSGERGPRPGIVIKLAKR